MPKQLAVYTLIFDMERETKNAIRFEERVDEGDNHVMGKVYVQRADLAKMGDPKAIKLTLEATK